MENKSGRMTTYLKISELATEYHRSRQTIYKDLAVIEQEPRYKGFWIYLHDGQPKLVNRNVYEDYLHHKTWLADRYLRKHVKPFDPAEVRRQRGESNEGESYKVC